MTLSNLMNKYEKLNSCKRNLIVIKANLSV
jgi:hypothetical protein